MKKIKWLAAAALTAGLAAGAALTTYAAGWKQDETGYRYENEDGTDKVSTWIQDTDKNWYFLDENGYMISNCYRVIDGTIYVFSKTGVWTGTVFDNIKQGTITGNNYSNEWSGFHVNVPETFRMVTAAAAGAPDQSTNLVEFAALSLDRTGSGVKLDYLDGYDYAADGNPSLEYIVTQQTILMELADYTITGVENVVLGGKQYMKISSNMNGLMENDWYCRKVSDRYFEGLTVAYWLASKPQIDLLLQNIY